ncbi:O-fucosyltransferase 20-like [Rutidosis leptorrhynchoides]|uniref:O-fucosyltransferase 20-like n=1 Tax=Rutidosis leptorrhynchoides TaxID=125765 RepID=UPI003A98F486
MAISKIVNSNKKHPQHHQYQISVSSEIISRLSSTNLQSLVDTPKKTAAVSKIGILYNKARVFKNPKIWFLLFFLCGVFVMLKKICNFDSFLSYPCGNSEKDDSLKVHGNGVLSSVVKLEEKFKEKSDFWEQPDGLGYRGCLDFSEEYKKSSVEILKDRTKYLVVVVSGGMNQQRNQIVDAVVIARILGATLVVPILQVNVIWGDESEFSDIFDVEHFKKTLADDVRIISSLPSNHLMSRPVEEKHTPLHVSPQWIRSRYLKRMRREGVLLLRGLDSRLSKDLPSDLQKLRCKVAFHALRFAPPIVELGNKFTERMKSKGPYLALHLRMEKDVWVRTGCLPGLTSKYDQVIYNERKLRPELLTSRSNMTYHDRKLAGLCPLNALEVTRLLKALRAPKNARIFWAGGDPLGGKEALQPLIKAFPNFYNKQDIAKPGELKPFANKASIMAALDYIVSENSDVFMPSHGGNMGHAIQGHRAYAGHKKTITPNKRQMLSYFLNPKLPEKKFNKIIYDLHRDSMGQPMIRTNKVGRDVTKYPIPECMCNDTMSH